MTTKYLWMLLTVSWQTACKKDHESKDPALTGTPPETGTCFGFIYQPGTPPVPLNSVLGNLQLNPNGTYELNLAKEKGAWQYDAKRNTVTVYGIFSQCGCALHRGPGPLRV